MFKRQSCLITSSKTSWSLQESPTAATCSTARVEKAESWRVSHDSSQMMLSCWLVWQMKTCSRHRVVISVLVKLYKSKVLAHSLSIDMIRSLSNTLAKKRLAIQSWWCAFAMWWSTKSPTCLDWVTAYTTSVWWTAWSLQKNRDSVESKLSVQFA